jgi:hypothetical protein
MLIILNYIKSAFISTESVKLHYSFIYNAYLRPQSYSAFVGLGFNAERSEAKVLIHRARSCAEQSEAKVLLFGFNFMKNAVVLNEVKLRFCERSELGLMF